MSRDTTKTDDFGEDSAMEQANPFSGLRDADIALAIIGSIQAAVPSVPAEILEKSPAVFVSWLSTLKLRSSRSWRTF